MKDLIIGVIYGGKSPEHDISIASAEFVVEVLRKNKYNVLEFLIDKEGSFFQKIDDEYVGIRIGDLKDKIDFALPILHGIYGEDGAIQGFFEILGIPYGGSLVLGSSVAMDKIMAKNVFIAEGIPTVDFIGLDKELYYPDKEKYLKEILSKFDLPIFIKPANLGSSVGISKVKNEVDLEKSIDEAFKYDRRVLVEKAVVGRELEIGVLGDKICEVSSIGEIRPSEEFYTLNAKYNKDKPSEIIIPAKLDDDIRKEIEKTAIAAYRAVDCSSFGRVDFFLDEKGKIYVNEINTIPGFTQFSMFSRLWEDRGVSNIELIERIIFNGWKRYKA